MKDEKTHLTLVIFSCDFFYKKDDRLWCAPILSSSLRMFADNFSKVGIVAILSEDPPDPNKHVALPENYTLHPIKLATGVWPRVSQARQVLRYARQLTRQYDVTYLRMFMYEPLPAALYCVFFLKKPWFLGLHGDFEEAVFIAYPFMNRVKRFLLAKTMGFISMLICRRPNPLFTAGPALGLKYAPQRKDWVPFMDCGITEQDIYTERTDTCLAAPYKLIYVGDMTRRKGIDILLAAISKLKQMKIPVELSVLGKGADNELKALKNLAEKFNVAESVNFAGYFPYGEKLFARIRQGDILVVASRGTEGTCRAITEANTQGLPVVTTDVDSLGIFVREWSFGIAVPPEDPEAMANAIKYIIEHHDERRKMVAQAIARGKHYIYEKEFLRIRAALEKVFGDGLVPLENISIKQGGR